MKRSPALQKFIDGYTKKNFGISDSQAGELGMCVFCQKKVKESDFRNEISLKEWHVSHLCQACQDSVFGKD